MSELPISCFRCRRRKIKCNKRKPCNQCTKQNVPCQFPSKFRNVSYGDSPEKSGSSALDSIEHVKLASPSDISKLEEQVRRLELENQYIGGFRQDSEQQQQDRFGVGIETPPVDT